MCGLRVPSTIQGITDRPLSMLAHPPPAAGSFDYESKRWGAAPLRPGPFHMNGLKLRYLLEDLQSIKGRVLDLGCGAGAAAKAVKRERPDLEVVGCDTSRSALAMAGASADGVDFQLATAERLPYRDGEFDFVWMFDVLEHVESPETVLGEVSRVLRPAGTFHIVLPLEGQPRTLYDVVGCGQRWKAKVRHCGHIQIFSATRFGSMAAARGLEVTRSRWSYHFLLQVLDLLYFSWLDWRGPVSGSVEDMSASRRGPLGGVMRFGASAVSCMAWSEARLLHALPGGCGHFTCVK